MSQAQFRFVRLKCLAESNWIRVDGKTLSQRERVFYGNLLIKSRVANSI